VPIRGGLTIPLRVFGYRGFRTPRAVKGMDVKIARVCTNRLLVVLQAVLALLCSIRLQRGRSNSSLGRPARRTRCGFLIRRYCRRLRFVEFNIGAATANPVDDHDYQIPFALTGKID
jgi:hypothetical protein